MMHLKPPMTLMLSHDASSSPEMANCLSYGVIASPSAMWQQNYHFADESLGYRALIALVAIRMRDPHS